jgi:hypothetical protein
VQSRTALEFKRPLFWPIGRWYGFKGRSQTECSAVATRCAGVAAPHIVVAAETQYDHFRAVRPWVRWTRPQHSELGFFTEPMPYAPTDGTVLHEHVMDNALAGKKKKPMRALCIPPHSCFSHGSQDLPYLITSHSDGTRRRRRGRNEACV